MPPGSERAEVDLKTNNSGAHDSVVPVNALASRRDSSCPPKLNLNSHDGVVRSAFKLASSFMIANLRGETLGTYAQSYSFRNSSRGARTGDQILSGPVRVGVYKMGGSNAVLGR